MSPILNPTNDSSIKSSKSEMVLLNKWILHSWSSGLSRGDVIFFKSPDNPRRILVKRIIGMQGDAVRRRKVSDTTLVDESPEVEWNLVKHAINRSDISPDAWIVIPPGHVWVESEARSHDSSHFDFQDSHAFGPIPAGLIIGRVETVVWPLERFGSRMDGNTRAEDDGRVRTRDSRRYSMAIGWFQ